MLPDYITAALLIWFCRNVWEEHSSTVAKYVPLVTVLGLAERPQKEVSPRRGNLPSQANIRDEDDE